ncbi:MAG: hypothetical protein K8L97_29665 [Anaerolineae bacterium]|nr:hypothetical protein [Anaerolineae bacterium]
MLRIKSPWAQGLLLYSFCFAVLSVIIFATTAFLGTDDYYHARIAGEIIHQGKLRLDFPWLPMTILDNGRFVDHHLLYHLYVAPFMQFGGIAGAKLATVSIAAGVFLAVWLLLRQINVRHAWLWTVAMFALSVPFIYRMLMIRTQGASLLFLIIALMLLFARHYRWLVILAFAYVWLYNGFILLLGFAILYTLAAWIADKKFEWQPIIYTSFGLMLGLIINPYFPQNLAFITDHLGAKVDYADGIHVGNEWYPYKIETLMQNSPGALLALVIALIAPSFSPIKRDRVETTLMLTALITLFMLLRSRRFIEYYPAFALLYAAAAWRHIRLEEWLPEWRIPISQLKIRTPAWVLHSSTVAVLMLFSITTFTNVYDDVRNAQPVEYLAGASQWLQQNTATGALIFQTDWDDFTRLFYFNTANTYLVGLDPTYLQIADPQRWDQWRDITQGRVSTPSELIQTTFNATYIVSDTKHDAFEDQVRDDPNMQLVYRDQYNYIWRIAASSAQSSE